MTAPSNVWMDNCHKMSISDKFLPSNLSDDLSSDNSNLSDDLSSNKLESRNFVRNSYIHPPISSFFPYDSNNDIIEKAHFSQFL